MLRIRLLGAPTVEVDGRPAEFDTRKAMAMLAYLALTRQPHRRDALAALLWPDQPDDRAKAALRRTLSTLRGRLDGRSVVVSKGTVALDREGVDLDVERFRGLAAAGRLAEAAGTYRGDLLEGFSLRDSEPFDEWRSFEAEGLRRELALVLERLVTQTPPNDAVAHARRWLALDPLHEPAHRALMTIYAASGDRAAAIRQYRECVRILEAELGVTPVAETSALYRAIVDERDVAPLARNAATAPAASSRELPLVGRDAERTALITAYSRVGPEGQLIVIEGEAGIGKTRLAAEVVGAARARGARVLVAHCHAGEEVLAFGAVADALRSGGATLPPSPPDAPGARTRFISSVAEALIATAGRSGLLFVDDAQWADAASLETLAFVVRRLRGRSLGVMLTWRSEDVPAEHPLRRLVAGSQRSRHATAIHLRRLARADVEDLVAASGAPSADAARLYVDSEGLPFFLAEYLAALEAGASADDVPTTVRDLIRARVAAASEIARQVLAAAAVIGRGTDADTVRDTSGRGEDETVVALEELVGRGLLREQDGAYEFAHDKFRTLVYDETSLARRRLLHRRAAEAIVRRSRERGDDAPHAVVAQHLSAAGIDSRAAVHYALAGDRARALHANGEALAHYSAALALRHGDPATLHESIGDLHTLDGDYAAALASYETAAALADDARMTAIEHKIGVVHQRSGDAELAERHLRAALARNGSDLGRRARLLADLSLSAHHRGRDDEALALAHQALDTASVGDDARALAQAHNILGVLASRRDPEAARAHLEQSLAIAQQQRDATAEIAALNNLALAHGAAGEHERALSLVEVALTLCAAEGDRHREAALHNNIADLLHGAGRSEAAMPHLKRAVSIFAEIGGPPALRPEIWKLTEW